MSADRPFEAGLRRGAPAGPPPTDSEPALLEQIQAEIATTGGAGLTAAELGDLYLFRAMSRARADWNAQPSAAPTDARGWDMLVPAF